MFNAVFQGYIIPGNAARKADSAPFCAPVRGLVRNAQKKTPAWKNQGIFAQMRTQTCGNPQKEAA
jgi:hypothetical protein